ncbi:p21 C-terminal-binding protein [Tritrichomonas foetus]|uniref:P21 C-terminal-binding protein n=1 Tax=Tritrichomonas foetus TaxID=1144522 RepID=A0A1J4KFT5_9EUKA|nr:p21 C-terminal-binding protein [Tritrichomonas foetus]|eukprot:OHT10273.1 p21 C-terminal-binding protein [Tritrichomonas foetus]
MVCTTINFEYQDFEKVERKSLKPKQMQDDYEEDGDFDQINANFCFNVPEPTDASGISQFVPKYLNCERIELGVIVANVKRVGTVIKVEAENPEDVSLFGFITVINLAYYQNRACIANFIQWLLSLNDATLSNLLTTQLDKVGFFLNERAYGVPPEIAPHLNRGIFEEVQWATEDLPTPEERNAYNLTHFLLVKKGVKGDEGIEFPLIEDDFYFKNADLVVEFQTDGEEGDLDELEYHRYVLVLSAQSIQNARNQLNEMFGIDESQYADEGNQ